MESAVAVVVNKKSFHDLPSKSLRGTICNTQVAQGPDEVLEQMKQQMEHAADHGIAAVSDQ